MKTIQLKLNETDLLRFNFLNKMEINLSELEEMIRTEFAKNAVLECNKIAKQVGLSQMNLEEINAEIKAVRNAEVNS